MNSWKTSRAGEIDLPEGLKRNKGDDSIEIPSYADVMELVDMLDLGSNASSVQVQVLSSVPVTYGYA